MFKFGFKYFLPYQARWAKDKSPLRICVKGRQVGASTVDGYDSVLKAATKGGKDVWIPTENIEKVAAHHPDTIVYPEAGHGFMRDRSEDFQPSNRHFRLPPLVLLSAERTCRAANFPCHSVSLAGLRAYQGKPSFNGIIGRRYSSVA